MVNKSIGLRVLILPLAVVFLIMFVVLFIQPGYSVMTAKKKAAEASQKQLASLQQQSAKLSELKVKLDSMEEKNLVQNALPESESTDDYISEVYTRVSRSGVLLKSVEEQSLNASGAEGSSSYVCGSDAGMPGGDVQATGGTSPAGGAPVPVGDTSATAVDSPGAPEVPVSAPSPCADPLNINLAVSGTWDQLLAFFQYFGDTNRIGNIKSATMKSVEGTQQEGNPDALTTEISVQLYSFKQKKDSANVATMGTLASKGGFNTDALQKIKDTVFSAFEEPAVSETGERNVFK